MQREEEEILRCKKEFFREEKEYAIYTCRIYS